MLLNFVAILVPVTMAGMTTTYNRGTQIVHIPSAGATEICVIPKKFPDAKYSKKDLEKEQELCSFGGVTPVALCPKIASTNPGVQFHMIPQGMTAAQVEAKTCQVDGAKMLAKYKGSTSCSYTPSLIGYYHVSRILGDILQVPPAVLRTMDLKKHQQIAAKGLSITKSGSLIWQTWDSYAKKLAAGSAGKYKDDVLTSDFKQSYAALQENPRNEERYSEMFNGGADTQERAIRFGARNPIYALLKDGRGVRQLVGNSFTVENAQKLQQMKDVSELIVMDTILNQHDRFGNVHYTMKYFYKDPNDAQNIKSESKMKPEEVRQTGAIALKVMMLKDNDCGVSKGNVVKGAKLAEGLRHMNQGTYTRLMKFNAAMESEETRKFFKDETLMTDADLKSVKANLNQLAAMLKRSCQAGTLKLDLDMDAHFAGQPLSQNCE
jgi:hypothetical protein